MSKILIAVPCMDQVPAPFAQSLAMIRKPDCDEVACAFQMGSLIYTSRNNLAMQAFQSEFDYVFWLDSDMVFSQDILIRMKKTLEENHFDFLTGLYFRRVPPFTPVLFDKLEIDENDICTWTDWKDVPEGLFKVGGCGFGAVLIKTDVLWDVQCEYGDMNGDVPKLAMFNPITNMGEDLSFCWRARQCGYDIWCDPSVVLGHVGYTVINDKFYKSYRSMHPEEVEK